MTKSTLFLAAAAASLLLTAGCRTTGAPPRTPAPAPAPEPAPDVSALLASWEPKTTWNPKSQIGADFDGDGVKDYAVGGTQGDLFVVGIVRGPLAQDARHFRLTFRVYDGDQNSLCSADAKIDVEDLDTSDGGDNVAPNAKGIALHDDRCDAFHIYWNTRTKRFSWWRL